MAPFRAEIDIWAGWDFGTRLFIPFPFPSLTLHSLNKPNRHIHSTFHSICMNEKVWALALPGLQQEVDPIQQNRKQNTHNS